MDISKRLLITGISLIGALLFSFPQALIIIMMTPLFLIGYFNLFGVIGSVFCLALAWNVAKLVKHYYDKRKNEH